MTRVATVFPGQGSQSQGMLAGLASEWPEVSQTFEEASSALGYDLWAVVRDNPEDALNRTEYTQPAMLTADVATLRTWRAAGGPEPELVAGHSLGEYAALVAAGAMRLGEAVTVVAERARLMQNAVPGGEGGMAAVLGLDDEAIAEICESVAEGRVVEPVNYNAPGQVVIAGHADAVRTAMEAAKERGAKRAVELPVSVPAHSTLMKEAADRLAEHLAGVDIAAPTIPVIHNVDAAPHADPTDIREALRRQLYNPVRWTESVGVLQSRGASCLVELGPGKVLTGLARRIDRRMPAHAVEDGASLRKAIEATRGEEQA